MLFAHCAVCRSIIHPDYLTQNRDLQEHEPMELRVLPSDDHSLVSLLTECPHGWLEFVVKVLDVRPSVMLHLACSPPVIRGRVN